MKIGLIARGDHTGLGAQTREVAAHLHPTKVLIVNVCDISPKNLVLNTDWYRGLNTRTTPGFPTDEDLIWLLDGVDVVYTAETAYNNHLYALAAERGVATVLNLNWEFLDHLQDSELARPTLFLAPSSWHYDNIPFTNKMMLHFPVATEHFSQREHPPTAQHFRHVIGWPAIHDRAGTPEVMAALAEVTAPIRVTIACQDHLYAAALMKYRIAPRVQLRIEAIDRGDYWDVLGDADVLLAPRRFGGLYLTVNEALAAGMPVIMTDMAPNNDWLPQEWLVPTVYVQDMIVRAAVEIRQAHPTELARLIDRMATDEQFYSAACQRAAELGQNISWQHLLPDFKRVLSTAIEMVHATITPIASTTLRGS